MKAIKLLFFALAMGFATSASAQFVSSGAGKTGGSSSSSSMDKSNFFLLDLRVGGVMGSGGFGVNLGGEKRYNEYLAWDYINVEFAAPFNSPADTDILSLKTGIRGFSPSFAEGKLRVYSTLAMGYTCVLSKYGSVDDILDDYYYYDFDDYFDDYFDDDISAYHGFGLTFGVGLQFNKKYSIGYSLQYETAFKSKSHLATFGFAF